MVSRGFVTDQYKELAYSDKPEDVTSAFLRAAGDIEHLLFEKLYWEKQIPFELTENWTLGRLIQWNYRLGLIDSKSNNFLQDFCSLRNLMFHERLMFERAKFDKEFFECFRNATLQAIQFIEQTKATYKTNDEIERGYSSYSDGLKLSLTEIKRKFGSKSGKRVK